MILAFLGLQKEQIIMSGTFKSEIGSADAVPAIYIENQY
jgi:hypothetical protein